MAEGVWKTEPMSWEVLPEIVTGEDGTQWREHRLTNKCVTDFGYSVSLFEYLPPHEGWGVRVLTGGLMLAKCPTEEEAKALALQNLMFFPIE